jgi:hypothetical protein
MCFEHPCIHNSVAAVARKKYGLHLEDCLIASVHVYTCPYFQRFKTTLAALLET